MRLQYEQATQAVVASAATGATAGVTAAKSNVYSSRPGLEAVAEARLREMTDQCTHLFKLAASLNPGVLHGGSVAGFSMVLSQTVQSSRYLVLIRYLLGVKFTGCTIFTVSCSPCPAHQPGQYACALV